MRLSPNDNLRQQDDFSGIMQNSRKVVLLIPTLTATNFDSDMQSGMNVTAGDGTGQTASWLVYELQAVIMTVTQNLITFGQVPAGVEVGDVIFQALLVDDEVITRAYGNQFHYVYIDNETFRISSLAYGDTGQRQVRICGCKHFTPGMFRHANY